MSIILKIKSITNSLTDAEQRVADYILNNLDEISFMSIYDVADHSDVSVASVSRFVKKLECESFKSFKVEIARDRSASQTTNEIFTSVSAQDDDQEVVQKVFSGNIKSLEDTLRLVDINVLIETAGLITRADRVVFFGVGGSGHVARDAALRFSHLDIQAEAYTEQFQMVIQAYRMKDNDLAIGISHSGRSQPTVESVRIARRQGAGTAGISNYLMSPLEEAVDLFLCTSFAENSVKSAALSSRIAQLCLFDALYLLAARCKTDLWDVKQINQLAEDVFYRE